MSLSHIYFLAFWELSFARGSCNVFLTVQFHMKTINTANISDISKLGKNNTRLSPTFGPLLPFLSLQDSPASLIDDIT